jgi:hypothetical protein
MSLTMIIAKPVMSESRTKSGVIFATIICAGPAGDISSCSIVPASRSLIKVIAESTEPLRIKSMPSTPVTVNHEPTRPGLKK